MVAVGTNGSFSWEIFNGTFFIRTSAIDCFGFMCLVAVVVEVVVVVVVVVVDNNNIDDVGDDEEDEIDEDEDKDEDEDEHDGHIIVQAPSAGEGRGPLGEASSSCRCIGGRSLGWASGGLSRHRLMWAWSSALGSSDWQTGHSPKRDREAKGGIGAPLALRFFLLGCL